MNRPTPPPIEPEADLESDGEARVHPARSDNPRGRLPHERDESTDSAQASPDPIGEKAYDDVASGRQDTDRLPVTDEVYRRLKRS
ncbi:MAG TPA: hypothetical protein VFR90_08260 [Methylibium sp.]|uniref:hypothetical protein n=1 Tax=Methylibium sp. TaxID=2067992 RepID=UPI002DBAFE72|nr:hypothetical protein [Methylibium sp.]HEU4459098.1 hypothetical protein [Methylibium sp.]